MVSGFVWIFLYWIWLFPVFWPSWEKQTVFHSSLQAKIYFGQVLSKPEVWKGFLTLYYCMSASPVLYSVWYLNWRVQHSQECSMVISSSIPACSVCALFLQQVLLVSTQMWPQNKVFSPGRRGTSRNSVCYVFYEEEWIKVFEACL